MYVSLSRSRKAFNGIVCGGLLGIGILGLSIVPMQGVFAANIAWQGPSPGIWNTAANWNGGVVPTGPGDIAIFNALNPVEIISFSGAASAGGLQFNGAFPFGATEFTLDTAAFSTFTLNGMGADAGITNNVGANQTFNINLTNEFVFAGASSAGQGTHININNDAKVSFSDTATAGGTSIVNNASVGVNISGLTAGGISIGSLSGTGPVALGINKTLTLGGLGGTDTISGIISGTGTSGISKIGLGSLVLSGNNTYTGGTNLMDGFLVVNADSNLGIGGGLTLNGGVFGTTTSFTSVRNVVLGGGSLAPDAGTTLTLNGILSGGALNFIGPGNLILGGNNTYTGDTTISGGTFTFTGSTAGLTGNISNGSAVVFDQAADSSFSGVISGMGTLTKSSGGILTLSGNNTYTGGTFINGGTLKIDKDERLGGSTGGLAFDGGTLELSKSFNSTRAVTLNAGGGTINTESGTPPLFIAVISTFSGNFGGVGSLTKSGGGTLTLSGNNTYTGRTIINEGNLIVSGDHNLGNFAGGVTLNGGALLTSATFDSSRDIVLGGGRIGLDQDTTLTLNGILSGGGRLEKEGSGLLILSGNNTYTGGTMIRNGPLSVSADANLGDLAGGLTLDGGTTFRSTATFPSARNIVLTGGGHTIAPDAGTTLTLNGPISGGLAGYSLTFGPGNVILGGANTYVENTTINGGTLKVDADGRLGGSTGGLTFGGGTLQLSASFDSARTVTLNAGGGAINTGGFNSTFSGIFGGVGGLTKAGTGTLTLTGVNTYSGPTLVSGGTLSGNLSSTTDLTVNSGSTYDLNGAPKTIGSLAGGGSILLGAQSLTTGANNTNTTFSGILSGTGSFIKTGTGTHILSGANLYSGGTILNGGILSVGTDANLGAATGGLTFGGGTLQLSTSFDSARTVTLNAGGGTIDTNGQNSTFRGVFSGSGGLTKAGTGTLTLTGANTYSGGTSILGNGQDNSFLAVSNDTQLGTGDLTFRGGALKVMANNFQSAKNITLYSIGTAPDGHPTGGDFWINDASFTASLTGMISGSGAFRKDGPGTLRLEGPDSHYTYTGGTVVEAGTLIGPSTNGVFSTGQLFVNAGADYRVRSNTNTSGFSGGGTIDTGTTATTTTVPAGQTSTFSGTITGTGPFSETADGGTQTFTSSSTITEKTVALSATNGGTINAAGTINATGAVTLAATNGGSINAGGTINTKSDLTLTADNGGTITGAGLYTSSGRLIFKISESGHIEMAKGSSILANGIYLLGSEKDTKRTIQKIAVIDGEIRATSKGIIQVGSGMTVKGNGTFNGNVEVLSGGFQQPGRSIGMQTVDGNLTQFPGGGYINEIGKNGTASLIKVINGTATIEGATLAIVSDGSPLSSLTGVRTILTATGGVIGRFGTFVPLSGLRQTVQYFANSVNLIVSSFQNFAQVFGVNNSSNSAQMARYLDTFALTPPAGSDLETVVNSLDALLANSNTAGFSNALDQLQPSLFKEFGFLSFNHNALVSKTLRFQQQNLRDTAAFQADVRWLPQVNSARLASFHKLVNDHSSRGMASHHMAISQDVMSQKGYKQRGVGLNFAMNNQGAGNKPSGLQMNQRIKTRDTTVWIQSYGQLSEKSHSSNGNVGLNSKTGGMSLGADYQVMPNTFLGVLGGYSTTPFDWLNNRGDGRMNSAYGGLYGSWMDNCGLYVEGQFIAGSDRLNSKRKIAFSSINREAKQKHSAFQFSSNAEVGYAIPLEPATVQPYLNATYTQVRENGYREHGAGSLDLQVKSKTSQFLRWEAGSMLYRTFVSCETLIRPSLQLGFVQKRPVGGGQAQMKGGLVGQPQTLSVLGDNRVRNQLSAGASLTAQFKEGLYVIGNISGDMGSGEKSGEALLSVGYQF